jgi:hypothetical protein
MSDYTVATLGHEYTDPVSDFTGTAVYRVEFEHGCVHIGLQPKAKKDATEKPEPESIDEISVLGFAAPDKQSRYNPPPKHEILGQICKAARPKFTGKCTSIATFWPSGTVKVALESDKLDDKGRPIIVNYHIQEVTYKRSIPAKKETAKEPGGPQQLPSHCFAR